MKDSQFMTADEKRLVLKQWETFLKHGCKDGHFTNRLYKHLINNCSFIAHYDRWGFFAEYFGRHNGGKSRFLSQFDRRNAIFNARGEEIAPPKSFEYGMTCWAEGEYADINNAMIDIAGKYIPQLLADANDQQRQADIATARVLLGKHGIRLENV